MLFAFSSVHSDHLAIDLDGALALWAQGHAILHDTSGRTPRAVEPIRRFVPVDRISQLPISTESSRLDVLRELFGHLLALRFKFERLPKKAPNDRSLRFVFFLRQRVDSVVNRLGDSHRQNMVFECGHVADCTRFAVIVLVKWLMTKTIKPKQWARFLDKVEHEPNTGCWLWRGAWGGGGYPVVSLYDKMHAAHRVAYEYLRGPIPPGLQLDHLCRVRCCVNPDHVEPVTPMVNTMRGNTTARINKAKTHCPIGHPYSGSNLYVYRKTGERGCVECRRNNVRRSRFNRGIGPQPCL